MGIGVTLLEFLSPIMQELSHLMPGEVFPEFFRLEMFQRSLLAAVIAVSYTHLTLPTIYSV